MKKVIFVISIFLAAWNAYAYDLEQTEIHGFISQGYLISDDNNYFFAETKDGTFQFSEIGINFTTRPTENLSLGMQFLSRDLGRAGNNEVKIDWAFADYQYRNWLGLRVGMLKVPHGLYNQSRDIDAARTNIFLPQSVYEEGTRDLLTGMNGISIYGILPHGFSYQFLGGQIGEQKIKDKGKLDSREIRDVELDYSYSGQILWETPAEGLMIGASMTDVSGFTTSRDVVMGPPGTPPQNFTTDFNTMAWWVASLEYNIYDFRFSAEYFQIDVELYMNPPGLTVKTESQGYYGSLSYAFTDWLEVGTYYSIFYYDKNDKHGDRFNASKDFAVTFRFDIDDHWLWKIEGHHIDGLAHETSSEGEMSDKAFLFAIKTTFSF